MYRNSYDTDVTIWSPQGRLHQIEYGIEAVKLGACGVGLKSETHAVVAGFKRSLSKLAGYNKKLMKVDDHIGVTFSGITADAEYLINYMRQQCLSYRYVYGSEHPVSGLVSKVSSVSQFNTQQYSKRCFGCGLIIAGVDAMGPHIFETCPSGNYIDCYAIAFGNRSQPAKTYLEKHFQNFSTSSVDQLIVHAIKSLNLTVGQDQELTMDNISVGFVSTQSPWKELNAGELSPYIDTALKTTEDVVEL